MGENSVIPKEELYRITRETRNFEISLFWQRSNYFLALNTAIAVGFFSLGNSAYILPLGIFGSIASLLWFAVNLGGKFWQSRWEHRLRLTEEALGEEINLFSADWDTINRDVKASLKFANHNFIRRIFDYLVLMKPSVSLCMILLSTAFIILWFTLIILSF